MLSELVSASRLKNNTGQVPGLPKNPRLIKDEKFDKLKKSIQDDPEMLELREVIAYEFNGELVVIAGNMRLKACTELGIKQIPTKILPPTTPIEKLKAYTIKDNVPFGENDWEAIQADWPEAEDWGLDIPDAFKVVPEATEDDYEIPDEIETDIVLGDLFEIGEHRLLCGDSLSSDDVGKVMNGVKADMVFTDPPYNINYGNIKHPKFKQREIENDNMSGEDFEDFCTGFVSNIVLFNKGCVYMAGPPGPDGRIMFMAADKALHCSTVIIWNKDQFTLGRGKYQNKYEPIWFGWVDNGTSFYGDRKQTNVWDIPRPKKSEEHPTMKPVELPAKAIGHASRKDDIILDLFLGSGTTMVASHQLNRKCYGMELDPKYCQVIIDRMRKLDPALTILKNGVPLPL
jgi:DNA modification methylase